MRSALRQLEPPVSGLPGRLLDIDELCAYTGLKKKTVYDKVYRRKIPFIKLGQLLRFRLADIDDWIGASNDEWRQAAR